MNEKKIYIGFSDQMGFDELYEYFDIDNSHPEGKSKLSQDFGLGYIDTEDFEIYDRNDYEEDFNKELILDLLPFDVDERAFDLMDFEKIRSFFFLRADKIKLREKKPIKIFGPIDIKGFGCE